MTNINKILFLIIIFFFLMPISALDSTNKILELEDITVSWIVLENEIEFTLKAKTTGWIAIGFEPTKMMKDADIIIAYVKDEELIIEDHFATGMTSHKSDISLKGSEDIIGLEGTEFGGFTTVKFKRLLNTKDNFDNELKEGVTYKIILAYGKKDNFKSYHRYRTSAQIKI